MWLAENILTYNLEGYNRNKYYLTQLINSLSPLFLFLQEHWLPEHEATYKMTTDFPNYVFFTASSDMFVPTEDRMIQPGPTWHGTAIGWPKSKDMYIKTIPIISDRFCGVIYEQKSTETHIIA